jgi:hypothetical protein
LADGYTDATLSRQRFLASPFVAGERLYKTGDRARFAADGNIEFLGRADFQVKIRGFRIELGEIESRLLEHPNVREAVVLAREDVPGDKRLVAYYTASTSAEPSPEALKAHLSSKLAAYMVPAAYVRLPALPLTPSGKLDRQALTVPAEASYAMRAYEAPRGAVEIALATIWCELLSTSRVGRDDNFFELGGHSLHGMKLLPRVAEQLAVDLPVTAIFRHPTVRELARLVESRRSATVVRTGLEPTVRSASEFIPLAFTQLSRWHSAPDERPYRLLASALRLSGRLDSDALQQSIAETIRRHEALRTRIRAVDGVPMQVVHEPGPYALDSADLTRSPKGLRSAELQRRIDALIVQRIDLSTGPLFGASLSRLGDQDHVLALALHPLIGDGASLSILLRDILTTYQQLAHGAVVALPKPVTQFGEFATRQKHAELTWRELHAGYWQARLAGCRRLCFPAPAQIPPSCAGAMIPVQLSRALTAELRDKCRHWQTTVVMSVFCAYTGLVLRWCDVTDAVIRYQTNGRMAANVEHTIGPFAYPLHLRLALQAGDSFIDLMRRVEEEYCNAFDHADAGYINAQRPRPEFIGTTAFNWTPQRERNECAVSAGSSPVPFDHPLLTQLDSGDEPSILLADSGEEIVGDVYFSPNRYAYADMERFARTFERFVHTMVRAPDSHVPDIAL